MEIIHHKVQKIIVIMMLAIMIICVATPVFAATIYTGSINIGDTLELKSGEWFIYKTEAAAKDLDKSQVYNTRLKAGEPVTVEDKSGNVLKIDSSKYIYYGSTGAKNFTKINQSKVTSEKKENIKLDLNKVNTSINIDTSSIGNAIGQIGQGFVTAVQGIGESGILQNIFTVITELITRLVEMLRGIEIPKITIGTPVEKPVEGETEKGEIEENKQDDKDTEDVDNDEVNYIFIGDSRTVMMLSATRNDIKNTGNIVKEYAAVGQGYNYFFKGNMLNNIKTSLNNAPKGTKVIIWLGVNDLYQANNYVSMVNSLANTYTDLNFYYVSVTPVNEEKAKKSGYTVKNSEIVAFNNTIISGLNSKVKYIDVYNSNYNTIVNGTEADGLHYTSNTSKTIWSSIYSKL
ncbi:MAG: SGNH/GDSL hydrolase family protein [Clostridia bacterium]|nr:SGNH/GDSL hydrolase family protein [Clostridia bacterium]